MICPSCKWLKLQFRGRRYAFYPLGIAAVVGLLFAMLHQADAPQTYHLSR